MSSYSFLPDFINFQGNGLWSNLRELSNHPVSDWKSDSTVNTKIFPITGDSVIESKTFWIDLLKKKKEELLKSFAKLPTNWNGNNANAISLPVVEKALKLLCDLRYVPDIFPTGRNSIQFEFETDHEYLEVEIFENGFDIFETHSFGKEENLHTNETVQVIAQVKEFYAIKPNSR